MSKVKGSCKSTEISPAFSGSSPWYDMSSHEATNLASRSTAKGCFSSSRACLMLSLLPIMSGRERLKAILERQGGLTREKRHALVLQFVQLMIGQSRQPVK